LERDKQRMEANEALEVIPMPRELRAYS